MDQMEPSEQVTHGPLRNDGRSVHHRAVLEKEIDALARKIAEVKAEAGSNLETTKPGKFRRVCDAAAWWLRHTDNTSVGWGDVHLLHEICTLMQWKHDSWRTELRVLNALSKTPGELIPTYVRYERRCRNFYLPEHCPEELRPNKYPLGMADQVGGA